MDSFSIHDTTLNYNYSGSRLSFGDENYKHYKLLREALSYLGSIGFFVSSDKRIDRDYPILSKDHWQGRYKALEFKAERYPAGFKILFFQNVIHENPHGGEYDSDKHEKMPYLIRLQFELTIKKLSRFLVDKGIVGKTKPTPSTAEKFIVQKYIESWHKPQKEAFDLTSTHGESPDPYNAKDRDGKTLCNGQVKFFRDRNGYLSRGTVYHNINNMWWVIVNKCETRNIATFELFDLSTSDALGRIKKHRPPAEYVSRKEQLSKSSIRELKNEIKRRQQNG